MSEEIGKRRRFEKARRWFEKARLWVEGKWPWVEKFKSVLEILAIFIAALWAFNLYRNYEAPSNVTRVDLHGDLKWHKHSKDVCEAEYGVEFKNIGRVSVEIGRVRLSVFSISKLDNLPQDKSLKLIDPENSIVAPALLQEETKRLSGVYAPDERDAEDFSFIVRRSRGSLILFKTELWKKEDSAGGDPKLAWRDFRWDWVCGENPERPEIGQ